MDDGRRSITRATAIECAVEDGRVFFARPLPWMQANDFGNEVLRQNLEAANEFVNMYVSDAGVPQLEMKLKQKIVDWHTLLKIGFPDVKDSVWTTPRSLDMMECAQLALAACEVNNLNHLKHLIDPNSPTPTIPGGNDTSDSEGMTDGQKIESTSDSASVATAEMKPSA